MIMSLKQRKIKFEPRIKLNHNICIADPERNAFWESKFAPLPLKNSLINPTMSVLNPLTTMSDQQRISPYNINTIPTGYMVRIDKNINLGIIT